MKDDEIRSMVEKILDQMLKTSEAPEHKRLEAVQTPAVSGECLEDITKTDLRRQLLVTDPADAEGVSGHEGKDTCQTGYRQSRSQIPDSYYAARPG